MKSRYSSPNVLDLVSNQRAFTAASNDQLCMGKGKSYCTSGMLYFLAASCSSGAARAQSGHCRSSKTRSATFDPLGGRNTDVSPAHASDTPSRANTATKMFRDQQICLIESLNGTR